MFIAQQISFAFHILGLIFWIGGLVSLSRLLKSVSLLDAQASSESPELRNNCRMIWLGFVVGGLAIALVTGILQILFLGVGYYMRQGWFHMKLTAVLALLGVTGFAALQMMRLGRGDPIKRSAAAIIHGGAGGLAMIILLITYLGRSIA